MRIFALHTVFPTGVTATKVVMLGGVLDAAIVVVSDSLSIDHAKASKSNGISIHQNKNLLALTIILTATSENHDAQHATSVYSVQSAKPSR